MIHRLPNNGNHMVDVPPVRHYADEGRGKNHFNERDYLKFKIKGKSLLEARQIVRAWRNETRGN